MWIAACDDDEILGKSLTNKLMNIISGDDQVTFYNSGFALLDAAQKAKQPFDLVFLDIQMPGLSGIDSAKELKSISPSTKVVFLTNFQQYALQGHDIRAFHYLLKPLNVNKLKEIICEIRNNIDCINKRVLNINTNEYQIFLPYSDILYIENIKRTLLVHTRTNSYRFYMAINKMEKELDDDGFFRIHKSYIVNLSHIRLTDKSNKNVILTTNEILPVADRKINKLFDSLINKRLGV